MTNALRVALLALLRRLEWSATDTGSDGESSIPACPICGAHRPQNDEQPGHADDCELADCIRALEVEP